LKVFEKDVLRKTLGLMKEEVTRNWRKKFLVGEGKSSLYRFGQALRVPGFKIIWT